MGAEEMRYYDELRMTVWEQALHTEEVPFEEYEPLFDFERVPETESVA